MISKFIIIENLPKETQLEMYMILLVELGGTQQVRKNQFSQYWIPEIAEDLDRINIEIEQIKEKIRVLKKEYQNK